MQQHFKTVYFADHPASFARQRSITLAFGKRETALFEIVKTLSSEEIRSLLPADNWSGLQEFATNAGLSFNRYCVSVLKEALGTERQKKPNQNIELPKRQSHLTSHLHATFRNWEAEPLQRWYPYLEGYSTYFVKETLQTYASNAKSILDPFSGTGTTPLVAARMGLKSYYCEVNPLLLYIFRAKLEASQVKTRYAQECAAELIAVAGSLPQLLKKLPEDSQLAYAYTVVFGKSEYFSPVALSSILKLRTFIDRHPFHHELARRLLTVAILSALIPVSKLIRKGDVRFRTEAEPAPLDVIETVQSNIRTIAGDLSEVTVISETPILLTSDARRLGTLPKQNADALLTSPPYLNGTNYFRNTKVELWFLRQLISSTDLASFRINAITSGINDVSYRRISRPVSDEVAQLVERLEVKAYDSRIPRLVEGYFFDMVEAFAGVRKHLAASAPVLIDIGDSCYSGIAVNTPEILCSCLQQLGFQFDHEVLLRTRLSPGGVQLKQVLLAMRAPSKSSGQAAKPQSLARAWKQWTLFKDNLPHHAQPFSRRNWGHSLHSLCSYQGKMKPSLAYHLVRSFLPESGSVVLDPFSGVGTIPLEAALNGHRTFAFDISPAAIEVSRAKLAPSTAEECNQLLDDLEQYIEVNSPSIEDWSVARSFGFNGKLEDYYHPQTLKEVIVARAFFQMTPIERPGRSFTLAALLHILHGNRPYALSRRSHPITPFIPTGPVEYKNLMIHLRRKVERSLVEELGTRFVEGTVFTQDATELWPPLVKQLDAIITSPPFFDSTRFYLANWLRLWFTGWEASDFKEKPRSFLDERQKGSLEVYSPFFSQAKERLKPTGVLVMHLGKSKKCNMAEALAGIAKRWFTVVDLFSESVAHCESHGVTDKGTVSAHEYLILQ